MISLLRDMCPEEAEEFDQERTRRGIRPRLTRQNSYTQPDVESPDSATYCTQNGELLYLMTAFMAEKEEE